jgi:hypothetical protein
MYKFDDTGVPRGATGRLLIRRDITQPDLLCFDCEWVKPRDDFGTKPNGKPRSQCKKCVYVYIRERYKTDSTKWREYSIKHHYHISLEEYDAMYKSQDGKCAICGQPETVTKNGDKVTRLSIDHDHSCCPTRGKSCGKCIRGLLCSLCNNAIGVIEKVGSVEPFAAYLVQHARG